MKSVYTVLIIGAGRIGASFDTPDSKAILTHAHAFTHHPGFQLVGFLDTDPVKAMQAAQVWGGKAFSSISEAFTTQTIDIVVVATPDTSHFGILKQIASLPIKFVFAEKPLAATLSQATQIAKLYTTQKVPLLVNYSRRFVPHFVQLKQDLDKGIYGEYLTGTGYYGKGLLHNGSHLINLLQWYLGPMSHAQVINSQLDFSPNDPSIAAVLTYQDQPFYLQTVDSNRYTIFELDLVFAKKRVRIMNLGFQIETYEIKASPLFAGYHNLVKSHTQSTRLANAQLSAVKHIYNYLSHQTPLQSDLISAYQTMETCWAIKAQLN